MNISTLFVALLGRPADPTGSQWFRTLTKDGTDLSGLPDLSQTYEFKARYAGLSNTDIVKTLYQSLFNRNPDESGQSYWVQKLASGATVSQVALAMAASASDQDKLSLDAKSSTAQKFTAELDTPPEILGYSGSWATRYGANFLNKVDATHVPTEMEIKIAVQTLTTEGIQFTGISSASVDPHW
ncbi:DUF4214 domain-containing protein [Rhizobium oryzicola]|uniref:DUF4214 domain-containing protein n=1 Tax=Rhizobium oryzicola TaxID=1232668 RepID=A0ABT8SZS3_9HYPH|nr:DUF4214 domain-containing protein [Rhizobium oryzicola]MDO1583979.1 DUF4214 domain-containing protein [Rhizobium oryzicola]